MSLDRYLRERLVVLRPDASVNEAARAMADNHIGAVLVAEDRELIGVVTDRDLALDVVGLGLDPRATSIREVMSDELITVSADTPVQEVVARMRECGCRRVPIVEGGRPVGLVTLDDLLLEGDVSIEDARAIIRTQLELGAPLKPAGQTHPTEPARGGAPRGVRAQRRSMARAEATYGRLLHEVEERTRLSGRGQTERALILVIGSVCQRLTPDEARDMIAQLPSRLQPELQRYLIGPDRGITASFLVSELGGQLGLPPLDAEPVITAILEILSEHVSAGELADVRTQLPNELRALLPEPPLRKAG